MKKVAAKSKTDETKTRQQLINELRSLRQLVNKLRHEASEINQGSEIDRSAEVVITPGPKQALMSKTFDLTTDAIIFVDDQFCINQFNPGAEKIFGYQAEEVIAQPLNILLPKLLRANHNQYVKGFAKSSEPSRSMNDRSSVMGQRKDGTIFPAKVTITRLQHRGKTILAAFLRDITTFREMEEANRKIENELAHVSRVGMMAEISGSIAHELNQPLTAILTNAQVLRRTHQARPLDHGDEGEIITDLIDDARRAGSVIKRLRELLKPGPSNMDSLDLNVIVISVQHLLRSEFTLRQISLKLDLANDLPAVVADRIQLQQVLINLLTNAFDALDTSESKAREATVRTRQISPFKVEISISDNGTGIPAKDRTKIFDTFYSTKRDGMGMGLSICKTLLQVHGGQIWSQNNADGGASLHFTLQFADAPDVVDDKFAGEESLVEDKEGTATVFVVDDDPSVRSAMSRLIKSAGYCVETFESAQAFLQSDQHQKTGCMIVDLHMPSQTGLELQSELNNREYTLPVIFITGAGDTDSGVEAMKQGAMDFLQKPLDDEALLKSIGIAVSLDRKSRALYAQHRNTGLNVLKLTIREREVMNLVIKGLRNKQIAFDLGISEKTVKAHRGRMMRKMEVRSLAELVRLVESLQETPPKE